MKKQPSFYNCYFLAIIWLWLAIFPSKNIVWEKQPPNAQTQIAKINYKVLVHKSNSMRNQYGNWGISPPRHLLLPISTGGEKYNWKKLFDCHRIDFMDTSETCAIFLPSPRFCRRNLCEMIVLFPIDLLWFLLLSFTFLGHEINVFF